MSTRLSLRESIVPAVLIALAFALAARLPFFLKSDFPLNDGGMFLAMSRDVIESSFSLPVYTSYNSDSIPFAYPPLAFYLVAALNRLTGIDPLSLVRFIPLLANLATVVGVAFLARSLIGPRWAALLAPTIFALIPRSYEWTIMGGGLTRSLGFMFAVGCLALARDVYRRPTITRTLLCGALSAATLASHLELGIFVVYSLLLMALVDGRSLRALLLAYGISMLAVLLTSPWWLTVISRHGLAPFSAASLTSEWSPIDRTLAAIEGYVFPPGLVFGVLGGLATLGALASLFRGVLFLPLWLPAVFIWVPRSAQTEAAVPLALMAAVGLADVVGPGLRGVLGQSRPALLYEVSGLFGRPLPPRLSAVSWSLNVVGLLLLLAAVFIYSPRLHPDPYALDDLAVEERETMAWISENAPIDSQFLVLSTSLGWEADHSGEWFPVMADRRSPLTVQGSEWLPNAAFSRKQCLYGGVRSLAWSGQDIDALEQWARDRAIGFSHIYVSRETRGAMDWSRLIESAADSTNYEVLIDNPKVTVLERIRPLVSLWENDGSPLVTRDCQSFAGQSSDTQRAYVTAYGLAAARTWVDDHDGTLGMPVTFCGRLATLGLGHFGIVSTICKDTSSLAAPG